MSGRFSLYMKQFVPISFIIGAGMELFMINTGFYDVALRKEAERRAEAEAEYQARRARGEARRRRARENDSTEREEDHIP